MTDLFDEVDQIEINEAYKLYEEITTADNRCDEIIKNAKPHWKSVKKDVE